MEVDEPIEGGEVTSVIETGDMRGNSASAAINPPKPMEMAANGDNALSLGGINKFSQAADRRGQSLQDIERTISPSSAPTISGHADAEPGQPTAPVALPAAAGSCLLDAL